jgi:peptide deformylase
MAQLTLRTWPDPILSEPCSPVTQFGEPLRKLVEDMAETMYAHDGVGLAAPQVGQLIQVVVLDTAPKEERGKVILALVNPEIIAQEGQVESEEGCLSLPDMTLKLKRAEKITVKARDLDGQPVELTVDGLTAIALQHEIDHLVGKVLFDRISALSRRLAQREYMKKKRAREEGKADA